MAAARYIEHDMRDFAVSPAPRNKGKARKAIAEEDAALHAALRLSLQRIVREAPPAEAAKSRDFSVYTGTTGYCLLLLVLHSRGIGFGNAGRTGQLAAFANPLELASLYLDSAQASLERQQAKRGSGKQGFTFLTGATGVHAVAAAVAQRAGDATRCRYHAREVAAMELQAMSEDEPRSHDVLNGLAGYLSALLFVRANTREDIGEEEIPDPLILRVVERIVADGADAPAEGRWGALPSPDPAGGSGISSGGGQSGGEAVRPADQWGEVDSDAGEWENPNDRKGPRLNSAASAVDAADGEGYGGVLTYEWHSKMYLGAAHGVSGILFVLMQALQTVYGASLLVDGRGEDGAGRADLPPQAAEQLYLIRSTVDAVLETALPEGNFPSRPGRADDRLVQWCHGAPGVIPMLTKAHEVFEDERYLEAARRSSDVVWKRGLLTKGNGICHGVAGNAYAFLSLRKADPSDGRHLHRARSFATFTASAILGPNPTAGANAFRGDPFGPGAHLPTRVSGGNGGSGGLGRSYSHDSGKPIPTFGWPGSSGPSKSSAAVNVSGGGAIGVISNGGAGAVGGGGVMAGGGAGAGGVNGGGGSGGGGGGGGGGGRSATHVRSNSVGGWGAHHELQTTPDRPMSLFEGLAGAAAFLADIVPEGGVGERPWFPSLKL